MSPSLSYGIFGLLLLAIVQVAAQPLPEKEQCPAVFGKLHEEITNSLILAQSCGAQKATNPDCRVVDTLLRRLVAEREKLCRDNNIPQGVCGCAVGAQEP